MAMGYKRAIDSLRRQQERIKFNLKQISYDICTLPPDLSDLFKEHHNETRRYQELQEVINRLQPAWRRWLGVPY